jgi:hypothetical protein
LWVCYLHHLFTPLGFSSAVVAVLRWLFYRICRDLLHTLLLMGWLLFWFPCPVFCNIGFFGSKEPFVSAVFLQGTVGT